MTTQYGREPVRISLRSPHVLSLAGSSSNVVTVSSGVNLTGKKFCRILAIGGGSGGFSGSTTTTLGYIAATSGGSPTTALQTLIPGHCGASGASVLADIDLSRCPSKTLDMFIGAAGTAGAVPTNGGETYVSIGGVRIFTAGGGVGPSRTGGSASFNHTLSRCVMSIVLADGVDGPSAQYEIVGRANAYDPAVPILSRAYGGYGGKPGLNGTAGQIVYWAI